MKNLFAILFFISSVLVSAEPFRYIVATDGSGTHTSVQTAIDACPDGVRSIIFIKNGTYFGQTSIGSKSVASNKLISLVGESRDSVILTFDKSLPMVSTFEQATTFQIYAKNFYAENITFVNSAGNTGQALALYTAGDMATFKNCTLKGYQDTYRSKKGTRGYFKNCRVEGAVDFIYAGGTLFFDDCTINCVKGGGYIVAPEDAYATIPATQTVCGKFLRLGFFFRNCNITANADVPAGSYYLGRPWNTTAGAFYINCKLGNHIKAAGWQTMGGNETSACFAEYNSMDVDGNPVDVSGRVSWSFQLPKADVDNLLTPAGIYARINSTDVYDPLTLCITPASPSNVVLSGKVLSWNPVDGVGGYVVYKNNKFISNTATTTYTDETTGTGNYSVMSIGLTGQLSEPSGLKTALHHPDAETLQIDVENGVVKCNVPAKIDIYTIDGKCVKKATSFQSIQPMESGFGSYIIKATSANGETGTKKLIYTPN